MDPPETVISPTCLVLAAAAHHVERARFQQSRLTDLPIHTGALATF
jgi:hypothetical protein